MDHTLLNCDDCGTIYAYKALREEWGTCPLCKGKRVTTTSVREMVEHSNILIDDLREYAIDYINQMIDYELNAGERVIAVGAKKIAIERELC